MKKESSMTYNVGSHREFAEWTKRVVRDRAGAGETPKRWFDSEATAQAAWVHTPSPSFG